MTIPEAGSRTARDVLSLSIARVLDELRALSREEGRIRRLVEAAERGALVSVVRRPTVAVFVRCLRSARDSSRRRELLDRLVAALRSELVALDAIPADASLPIAPPRRTHAIDDDLVLALDDDNPLAMEEAHPEKFGNAIDLGGRSIDEWIASLRSSLATIETHLSDLRGEMRLFVQQIVPVGFDAEKHLSASYREAIGSVYLTLHPNAMTMTEALIHEFSHNKINALFEIDDVLENAFEPLFASPVRPDPRPLHGVLLAVHAFLPVARLYETMIEAKDPASESPAFSRRFREIVAMNEEGAQTILQNARPTEVGRGLLDELARWRAHYAALRIE